MLLEMKNAHKCNTHAHARTHVHRSGFWLTRIHREIENEHERINPASFLSNLPVERSDLLQ